MGLQTGSVVDITRYGTGLPLVPAGRTAEVVERDRALVATSDTVITDDMVVDLIDAGRR